MGTQAALIGTIDALRARLSQLDIVDPIAGELLVIARDQAAGGLASALPTPTPAIATVPAPPQPLRSATILAFPQHRRGSAEDVIGF